MDKKLEVAIKFELENIGRLVNEAKELQERIDDAPDPIETRASGSILHDFYCGVEKIFERIAVNIDKNLPAGENWHADILVQMANPVDDIRDRVIDPVFMNTLKEYMRFRHLFRRIYGFELNWIRFKDIFLRLENTFNKLSSEIEKFMNESEYKNKQK